jgi:hypothetical protein
MSMKVPIQCIVVALGVTTLSLAHAEGEAPATTPAAPPAPSAPAAAAAPATPTDSVGVTVSTTSESSTDASKKDKGAESTATTEEKPAKKNPFRGSIFLFDQSILTSDLSKGSQLSPSPLYEWWISPRVYYSFDDHIRVGARFDFFKEVGTNHEESTLANEWRYGDPWLNASYGSKATFLNSNPKTRWTIGALVRPPMSKESRANGQYLAAGPTASLSYGFDLLKGSKFLSGMSLALSASYSHAFTKSQTPDSFTSFSRPRMTPTGSVEESSQVRSGTLAGNSLIYSLSADVDVTEKISFSGSFIMINQFSYQPSDVSYLGTDVAHGANDTRLRQLSWFLLDIDYALLPEVSLSLGYYNLNTTLAPDGTRRNVLWSPESRLFFSITANLDVLYDTVSGKPKPAAAAGRGGGANLL